MILIHYNDFNAKLTNLKFRLCRLNFKKTTRSIEKKWLKIIPKLEQSSTRGTSLFSRSSVPHSLSVKAMYAMVSQI